MEYSKKDKQKIRKTMDILIKDLDKLWQLGLIDEISIPIDLTGIEEYEEEYAGYRWLFYMDENAVKIRSTNGKESYLHAQRAKNGKLKGCYSTIDIREVLFFREYEKIRAAIMEKIEEKSQQKQSDFELMDRLTNNFNKKENIVELKLPETNNLHELKVQRENGRTVGTIDFGRASIKIITNGTIRLVKENKEPAKTKQK